MKADLRSDTFTKPTAPMLEAMMAADVGDDVFGEDPTINKLENEVARLFGFEAGLFCPSGTMSNQIALKVHTVPGNEIICDELSHIYHYEGGGIGFNSGCSVKLLKGDKGRINASQVRDAINPPDYHYAQTTLVSLENSTNKGGGRCYELEAIKQIKAVCDEHNLKLHLDGARVFNACEAKGYTPAQIGQYFDSISICFSKGLGCPVGSVLVGSADFIKRGRRIRKVLGGGMRQAGYLAAAGLYALAHHIERLADDHRRAKQIAETLANCRSIKSVVPSETNIVIAELTDEVSLDSFINHLKEEGILVIGMGKQLVRFVTHLEFTDEQLQHVLHVLRKL